MFSSGTKYIFATFNRISQPMPEDKQTKLKKLLTEKDVSQKELGKRTGLALSTISEIVSGKLQYYQTSTLFKICRALSVSPDKVLDFEERIR